MEKVQLNIDAELAKQGKALFEDLGFSLETAISVFIKQSLYEKALPFKPSCNSGLATKATPVTESRKIEKPKTSGKFNLLEKASMLELDSLR